MISRKHLAVGALAFVLVVSGCSTQTVRCDGKLSPINAPASATKATPARAAETTP
jgi:hypothetical protein